MAERPRESLAGIVGALCGLYSAKKLANIESGFSQFSSDIARVGDQITTSINYQTSLQKAGFKSLIELQVGNMYAINKVNSSIQKLDRELSKITNVMERDEKRKNRLAEIRLVVISFEEALNHIDTLKEKYTPWAAFETRVLMDIKEENKINVEELSHLPFEEFKQMKGVLDRVEATHRECLSLMEGKS